MEKCVICLLLLTSLLLGNGGFCEAQENDGSAFQCNDYKNHPCTRPCLEGALPKLCRYYFLLEHYTTMSTACYDCPSNSSHCFLPQCVLGSGGNHSVLTVNRMLPGPTINVCQNDVIEVTVDNRLEVGEGVSIHWHGQRQRGTPHMDGTALVTQCPLHSGAKMTYRFKATEEGTHFWHSHSNLQRSQGIFGGLIVRTPPTLNPHVNLYDLDLPEHVIMLKDWVRRSVDETFAMNYRSGVLQLGDAILVNGLGHEKGFSTDLPYPSFKVMPGLRYRFRVIVNGLLDCPLQVSIDDHHLLMIASDGSDFVPYLVDSFTIFSGERYDFVLQTKPAVTKNYWIRFKGFLNCGTMPAVPPIHTDLLQLAVLQNEGTGPDLPQEGATYDNSEPGQMSLSTLAGRTTNETIRIVDLSSVYPDDDPDLYTAEPDKRFHITLGQTQQVNPRFEFPPLPGENTSRRRTTVFNQQLNYITSHLPPSPPLSQLQDIPESEFCNNETLRAVDCSVDFCTCIHRLQVALGDLVEMVLINYSFLSASHPMHLHGHRFRVMGIYQFDRELTVDEVRQMDAMGEFPRRHSRAPLKDTLVVHARSVVIIRFRADNPGFWLMHCHIEFHTETGMTLLLQTGSPEDLPKPPRGFPRCGDWAPPDLTQDELKALDIPDYPGSKVKQTNHDEFFKEEKTSHASKFPKDNISSKRNYKSPHNSAQGAEIDEVIRSRKNEDKERRLGLAVGVPVGVTCICALVALVLVARRRLDRKHMYLKLSTENIGQSKSLPK
ncbi:laccase [Aplysia californica]|uniref:Laccase n=1 Tax=Aplysia californica TaxID=6500 RepID=A0ABM1A8R6_APLCA|nr:laccase [Aplysia californica]